MALITDVTGLAETGIVRLLLPGLRRGWELERNYCGSWMSCDREDITRNGVEEWSRWVLIVDGDQEFTKQLSRYIYLVVYYSAKVMTTICNRLQTLGLKTLLRTVYRSVCGGH